MPISISGDGTLTGVSVGGLPDGIVDTDMLATSAVSAAKLGTNTFVSYAVICDQKAQDTDGGTFTNGAWRIRDLNTEIFDPDGIVSISSNEFTLDAGSYLIEWSAPGMRCSAHKTRLYDVTADAAGQLGSNAFNDTGTDGDQSHSFGSARVTIASSNSYRIEHRCESTSNTLGLGYRSNFPSTAEIYTVVKIFKEA